MVLRSTDNIRLWVTMAVELLTTMVVPTLPTEEREARDGTPAHHRDFRDAILVWVSMVIPLLMPIATHPTDLHSRPINIRLLHRDHPLDQIPMLIVEEEKSTKGKAKARLPPSVLFS
jgi:hypothetical protein